MQGVVNSAWILAGATATGKSGLCQILAQRLGASVLSADSMLVYKGMDIGTAKPSPAERSSVSYYGLDLVTPDQPFSTGAWLESIRNSLKNTPAPGGEVAAPLIVTGGTGLYLKALTSGLEAREACPEKRGFWQNFLAQHGLTALQHELRRRLTSTDSPLTESTDHRRIIRALEHLESSGKLPANWLSEERQPSILTLRLPRAQLHERIRQRVQRMFADGLLDEVRELKRVYPQWSFTACKAIGYQEALEVLGGKLSRGEAMERIIIRTRQLAKRQETWFRHQQNTLWCDIEASDLVEVVAEKVLHLWHEHGKTQLKI
ncbi:MAG: tRNA (adenosine(37)-N6)-dimethylallyltransferase MiaA [Kiritimatiellae bacterium]|nr:tRNA (adenosine(37)-N6)-dimethylallyltransferase MiaA [Kiritimatiellia bacterium]